MISKDDGLSKKSIYDDKLHKYGLAIFIPLTDKLKTLEGCDKFKCLQDKLETNFKMVIQLMQCFEIPTDNRTFHVDTAELPVTPEILHESIKKI